MNVSIAAIQTITRDIRMFGDPVSIIVTMAGSRVSGVSATRGNERCRRLVEIVDRQLKADRDLVAQHWNVVALSELVWNLLEIQDVQNGAPASYQPAAVPV